ncbi:hypothetical protein APUTEX25_000368 [Auxenochlorella protothecoides]|uniref:Rubisco LSMT substrate-binding domain-containing protein n=2 Tax=Auxenochlorella protothecoides TaxID=3075 RepID=A0A3M7KWH1_AUXPR|nr:hypothetical protein APUTEX25_000368 [Auxenochlorella protothecoides]|eukprot:RMZ54851.1 hypothetical protein APUTEX25_000368 [Auxenochlorella protothecoides]
MVALEAQLRPCALPRRQCFRRYRTASAHRPRRCTPAAAAESPTSAPSRFVQWLQENGLPEQGVRLETLQRDGAPLDTVVASRPALPGDVVLRVPDRLVVTLDRIFHSASLAELLTTSKLSELACLTLYLAYEKKRGTASFWHPFIKELDRLRGKGQQGARSPILWEPWQVEQYLAGSPLVAQVNERMKGIDREYAELDTVWFMAGSLFNQYPYDIPTEQFTPEVFRQAFAAVQSCVVHLQGVPLSQRFALVPLGPPLLTYSSTASAMLRYDPTSREVQLAADRAYRPGEPVLAWCGPQPNSRLLLNYGIVDEANPYDRLPLEAIIPASDPLYSLKRGRLAEQGGGLATQQLFQLSRGATPLPAPLFPFLRLALARTPRDVWAVEFGPGAGPLDGGSEARALGTLRTRLAARLARYPAPVAGGEGDATPDRDPETNARRAAAARLVGIEQQILRAALAQIEALPFGQRDTQGGEDPGAGAPALILD